jgi:diguanylate cyclase (GGDEF)-like protein
MNILIVDDSKESVFLIQAILKKGGYLNFITAGSADEAFKQLAISNYSDTGVPVELILLDIVMPDMDGIEALKKIKEDESIKDIPVVMVTANTEDQDLQKAFELGAVDYVTKPFSKTKLLARVRSVLKLKHEMDRRMELAGRLEEANRQLQRLVLIDGLTGTTNRRHFDTAILNEWERAQRNNKPLSFIIVDIDYFKSYNDNYGHQMGDICLKKVANALMNAARRSSDLVARYGGEEFGIILPGTDSAPGLELAEKIRSTVESLKIKHEQSQVSDYVTISLGVATIKPRADVLPECLVKAADAARYRAKEAGRNVVEAAKDVVNCR